MKDIIDSAAEACGGIGKLAALIDQSPQVVSNWRTRGVPIPQCPEIERATGGMVTRRHLRPDDWHRIWPELVNDEHPAPEPKAA